MIRTHEYKLINYQAQETGKIFNLTEDPHEFENMWNDPEYIDVRFELLRKSLDTLAFAVDTGPHRVGRY